MMAGRYVAMPTSTPPKAETLIGNSVFASVLPQESKFLVANVLFSQISIKGNSRKKFDVPFKKLLIKQPNPTGEKQKKGGKETLDRKKTPKKNAPPRREETEVGYVEK